MKKLMACFLSLSTILCFADSANLTRLEKKVKVREARFEIKEQNDYVLDLMLKNAALSEYMDDDTVAKISNTTPGIMAVMAAEVILTPLVLSKIFFDLSLRTGGGITRAKPVATFAFMATMGAMGYITLDGDFGPLSGDIAKKKEFREKVEAMDGLDLVKFHDAIKENLNFQSSKLARMQAELEELK